MLVVWARRHLSAVAVEGESMMPTFEPGDWVLVESLTYARRAPRVGEVVVVGDPRDERRELVKRVRRATGGRLEVRGDAAGRSTDSRDFGPVDAAAIRWRARLRYWPPARAGLVA